MVTAGSCKKGALSGSATPLEVTVPSQSGVRTGTKTSKTASHGRVNGDMALSNLVGSVLVADDHDIVRFGLVQLLRDAVGGSAVVEAATFDAALEMLGDPAIAVVIMDLDIPGLADAAALSAIRQKRPDVRLLVLTASESREDMLNALRAGAHGFITKKESGSKLLSALQQVIDGQIYVTPLLAVPAAQTPREQWGATGLPRKIRLTPRQRELLPLLAQGRSNKEIAQILGMSVSTAKFHVASMLRTLDANNRAEAAGKATRLLQSGLVD